MRANGRRLGFNKIGFIYEYQIFNSTYDQKLVKVEPFSTQKVRTSIVQTLSVARFTATFVMHTSENKVVQF